MLSKIDALAGTLEARLDVINATIVGLITDAKVNCWLR